MQLPVAGGLVVDADDARQRLVEDAERIRLADGQVDRQGGRRHQPAVEARSGQAPLPVEEGKQCHAQ